MNITFTPKGETARADALIVGHTLVDVVEGDAVNVSNPCPIHGGAKS